MRARETSLPLSWTHFEESTYLAESDHTVVRPLLRFDGTTEVRVNEVTLRELALEAFARGFLRCDDMMHGWIEGFEDEPPPLETSITAVLALDGLRVCFERAHLTEELKETWHEFLVWAGDWNEETWSLVSSVEMRFKESLAFVRGWEEGGASTVTTADHVDAFYRARVELRTSLDALTEQLRSPSGSEAAFTTTNNLFEEFRSLIDQVAGSSVEEEVSKAIERAERAAGRAWSALPTLVKELLIDVEFIRPLLLRGNRDWYPVILGWSRCVEVILRSKGDRLDTAIGLHDGHSWSEANLGAFVRLFKSYRPDLPRELRAMTTRAAELDSLNQLRNRAAHGSRRTTSETAGEAYKLLFSGPKPLFREVANITL